MKRRGGGGCGDGKKEEKWLERKARRGRKREDKNTGIKRM